MGNGGKIAEESGGCAYQVSVDGAEQRGFYFLGHWKIKKRGHGV